MKERGHILEVLRETRRCLKKKDSLKIKNLSDEIIHNSSISQDPDIISMAVILYSLSKMIEREHYKEYANSKEFYKNYIKGIDNLIFSLEKNNMEKFRSEIHFIAEIIRKLSGNIKIYISDVFRKARINKASKIYEHGISMEKTAKILGISVWELAEYAGQAKSTDINLSITMPIKERIKIAENFLEK